MSLATMLSSSTTNIFNFAMIMFFKYFGKININFLNPVHILLNKKD
jgi:hypothetical protein